LNQGGASCPFLLKKNQTMQLTAILSALAPEQHGLIELLHKPIKVTHAGRVFWQGDLHGRAVVLALSKIGKVAAATTAAALIERFGVQRIVFTGVAGGLGVGINVGDVVVSSSFLQHDMDSWPLFPRYEVPLYGKARFDCNVALTQLVFDAATAAVAEPHIRRAYPSAKAHRGLIASGDRFVSDADESNALRSALLAANHTVLAVEMEGAAVAQVCHDYSIPFAAVRTISDRADNTAHVDFPSFIEQVASKYALTIVERFLKLL
jgi:adenosylhomocysteine nucleosidase